VIVTSVIKIVVIFNGIVIAGGRDGQTCTGHSHRHSTGSPRFPCRLTAFMDLLFPRLQQIHKSRQTAEESRTSHRGYLEMVLGRFTPESESIRPTYQCIFLPQNTTEHYRISTEHLKLY
jgi:hypothetical protein